MCFWTSVKETETCYRVWQGGRNAARGRREPTVDLLNVNVVRLRVADGDLLIKPALSEDEAFLQSNNTQIKLGY